MPLPIETLLPDLRDALRVHAAVVLQAPPGAGKTTLVPLALLHEPWLVGRKILVLEPRRLAARAAARRMAQLLGENVGETVGYRVRLQTVVGPNTRIEVVTEGILTRLLQDDPALEEVGIILFDEFHERSLQADLGLALARQSQQVLRPDLRLLVMSATLDADPIAVLLANGSEKAPLLTSEGRSYPVETLYLPREDHDRIEKQVVRAVAVALREHPGDALVFLPGAAEIRRVATHLAELGNTSWEVYPLYGDLSPEMQDRALAPAGNGSRKVVLATSIAETSLTIEGIRVVVDSGLSRVPRFNPRTGLSRLETVRVSQASATQRQGRAGRTAPGWCYRLWTEAAHAGLAPFNAPEILQADLAPLALELAVWGIRDPGELAWLDAPPAGTFAQARALLHSLDTLDAAGKVTSHGQQMATLGLPPRLAHLVLRGKEIGQTALACHLAGLLLERDPLRAPQPELLDIDLGIRLEALAATAKGRAPSQWAGMQADRGALARAWEQAQHLARQLGERRLVPDPDPAAAGLLLAFAYPDRIAQRLGQPTQATSTERYRLRSGPTAQLTGHQSLGRAEFLVAAHLDGRGNAARIFLAAEITKQELYTHFKEEIERAEAVRWDAAAGVVRAQATERLGALVLQEKPLAQTGEVAVREALLDGIRQTGLQVLPWDDGTEHLRARLGFMRQVVGDPWPDVSDAALATHLDDWLGPFLVGMQRLDDLRRLDLAEALLSPLAWTQRQELDRMAPSHLVVPSGSRRPLDYSNPAAPVLAVRLQEVFGMLETPRIADGRVPLMMHLLSPAGRPVQVTQDLHSFWRTTYFDVRKDLRGRYPKHHWPDDPLAATPTARAKRRGT
ncbi:ATP-dependent helicase HrpB [Catalinimonas alkaloidigena]|uniref:ATP-dependent helicase HrpB n=1 Tax=Catalinimonas alkaloidigena TaxID=1075417 RepID=A0A1G9GP59_9BACT|nr:ATP-dependent helicase HrpB [Catalinimonas alkaloidigena]SDL02402.1 ATP-dependent helicase HrpB [Catalinimonas alkaloidigena]